MLVKTLKGPPKLPDTQRGIFEKSSRLTSFLTFNVGDDQHGFVIALKESARQHDVKKVCL
ncbi:hypothetical protein BCT23_20390 [Enterovibrio norvegicus]|uniref:Uncharacterized protein n=1 Tax=Enterovibrio norvegicus TaxID=188144 RepID=A0A2N7L7R2_9GAMM|nr:hypothetical protein BCT69_10305 [Enterovibrio norvegicus]PMN90166.1 hypothetical protein BCT23_20390 [Enterovibrio norvegicus]